VREFLQALATGRRRGAVERVDELRNRHREFGIYEDYLPTRRLCRGGRDGSTQVRGFNLDVARLNSAVDSYNAACGTLDHAAGHAEASRSDIAEHAHRILLFVDGMGGGELLPFVE
jgi:hypothetical protein